MAITNIFNDNPKLKAYANLITEYAKKNYRMCFREPDGQNLPHCFIVPGSAYSDALWDWDARLSTLS